MWISLDFETLMHVHKTVLTSHLREQLTHNALSRPRCLYGGTFSQIHFQSVADSQASRPHVVKAKDFVAWSKSFAQAALVANVGIERHCRGLVRVDMDRDLYCWPSHLLHSGSDSHTK